MPIPSSGRRPSAPRRTRRLLQATLGLGLVVAGVLALLAVLGAHNGAARTAAEPHGTAPLRSGSPTEAAGPGLPRLGSSQVVEQDDVGDPFVLTVPAGSNGDPRTSYVLYWTTDWRSNVPTAVSSDFVHWRRVADSLPDLPSWAVPSRTMTWGPTARRVGDQWVLYYSTQEAASQRECIGRATSASPTGPFTDGSSAPLVCQTTLGGDIDPSVVTDASGTSTLLWKNDGNATGATVSIWEQPLADDGLSLTGTPARLVDADQEWEHGLIEGPAAFPKPTADPDAAFIENRVLEIAPVLAR